MRLIKHQAIKACGEAEEYGRLSLINFPDVTQFPDARGSLCPIGNLTDIHVERVG
jgi:hypothetical protein